MRAQRPKWRQWPMMWLTTNVTWALFAPLVGKIKKDERKTRMVERAMADLPAWLAAVGV